LAATFIFKNLTVVPYLVVVEVVGVADDGDDDAERARLRSRPDNPSAAGCSGWT